MSALSCWLLLALLRRLDGERRIFNRSINLRDSWSGKCSFLPLRSADGRLDRRRLFTSDGRVLDGRLTLPTT
jgi:hypothetical protein